MTTGCGSQLASLAHGECENGDYLMATKMLTTSMRLEPNNHELYHERSICYYKLGEYRASLEDANTAIRLGSTNIMTHYQKGLALLGLATSGDLVEEAIKTFKKAIELKARREDSKLSEIWKLLRESMNEIHAAKIRLGLPNAKQSINETASTPTHNNHHQHNHNIDHMSNNNNNNNNKNIICNNNTNSNSNNKNLIQHQQQTLDPNSSDSNPSDTEQKSYHNINNKNNKISQQDRTSKEDSESNELYIDVDDTLSNSNNNSDPTATTSSSHQSSSSSTTTNVAVTTTTQNKQIEQRKGRIVITAGSGSIRLASNPTIHNIVKTQQQQHQQQPQQCQQAASQPSTSGWRDDDWATKYKRIRRDRERARRGTSKLCTIKPSDLEEVQKSSKFMRVIAPIDGWLYSGQLHFDGLDSSAPYAVKLDGDSTGRLFYFNEQTVLKDVIKEVQVKSVSELRKGARICCYWSRQYKCLSTGVVTSRTFEATKSLVSVKYDNGDLSALPLEDLRLLPPDYPKYMSNCDPLLLATSSKSANEASGSGSNINSNGTSSANSSQSNTIIKQQHQQSNGHKATIIESPSGNNEARIHSNNSIIITNNNFKGPQENIPTEKNRNNNNEQLQHLYHNQDHQSPEQGECYEDQISDHQRNNSNVLQHTDILKNNNNTDVIMDNEEHTILNDNDDDRDRDEDDDATIPPTDETIDFITSENTTTNTTTTKLEHGLEGESVEDYQERVSMSNDLIIDTNSQLNNNNININPTDIGSTYGIEYRPWMFEGPPKRSKRHGRTYRDVYFAIRRGNEVIRVGDSAELMPKDRSILPFIAKIDGFWATTRGEMKVRVRWYYRLAETKGEPYELHDGENALFETDHFDENDVQSIYKSTRIMSWTDYEKNNLGHVNKNDDNSPKTFYLAGYYDPVRCIKHLRTDVKEAL